MSNNKKNPQKWVQYDSEECPKCKTRTAHVLTRSTEDNLIYDGEEARCFTCQHTGVVSVEDSECADVVWDDYNPQEVPQVKSVERQNPYTMDAKEYLKRKGLKNPPLCSGISGGGDVPPIRPSDVMIDFAKMYSRHRLIVLIEENATYNNRIDGLENQNKILSEWFASSNNRIAELEKQNAVYKEALSEIKTTDWNNEKYFGQTSSQLHFAAVNIANKALNHKDK